MRKILAGFALLIALAPGVAFAKTTPLSRDQILQSIADLTAQIDVLRAQLGALPDSPAISTTLVKQSRRVTRSNTGAKAPYIGTYTMTINVTAGNNDLYIPLSPGSAKTDGFVPSVIGSMPAEITFSDSKCAGKEITGVTTAGIYYCHIPAGQTGAFSFKGTVANAGKSYVLNFGTINYKLNPTDKSAKTYHPEGLTTH